jgi:ribosomal protein S1
MGERKVPCIEVPSAVLHQRSAAFRSEHLDSAQPEKTPAIVVQAQYVGKDVEVAIMSVDEDKRSFLCSINNAISDKILRQLSIGSLVWGTVRKIENYGVFVAIDDTYESALLHIGNISWERVRACEDVFKTGDRVRAVVTGMDEGFTRLSVSTRDLEGNEGDMMRSKESVYRDAEQNVKRFLEHVAEWERREAEKAGAAQ